MFAFLLFITFLFEKQIKTIVFIYIYSLFFFVYLIYSNSNKIICKHNNKKLMMKKKCLKSNKN